MAVSGVDRSVPGLPALRVRGLQLCYGLLAVLKILEEALKRVGVTSDKYF